MKWTSVKKDSEFALPGIQIEIERVDGGIKAVTFSIDGKPVAAVQKYGWDTMTIAVPTPPKMVTKYRLTGEVKGFKIIELFEHKYEAESKSEGLDSSNIEEVEVPDDEAA